MHRGPAGAGTLNTLLQEALAPGREETPERRHGARVFRPGDKVIQIRNNYDKGTAGVFNGTVFTITALSVTEQQLMVRTDEDEDIATTSTSSTNSSTPTPSPCTAPRAANTRWWSYR